MPAEDQEHSPSSIARVRSFNRFYTRLLGLLDQDLLQSGYALAELRLLYELHQRQTSTAAELGRDLRLDPGYLSRLLKRLENLGIIERTASKADARQIHLHLTKAGDAIYKPLDEASQHQTAGLMAHLTEPDVHRLLQAMATIERLLGVPSARNPSYVLRPLRAGDIGWITHRHGVLYAQMFGWNESFEALVAEIGAAFVKNQDPRFENAWIAEQEAQIIGSIFLVRASETEAQLRLLYIEPAARGLGIGSRLVEECIRFARQAGYKSLTLWTNGELLSARKIYQAAGFSLSTSEIEHAFGDTWTSERWHLEL